MEAATKRFEPERAKEVRDAVREAFVDDHKLKLADVVFERGPRIPDGEVGVIVQTAKKLNGSHGLMGEYLDLPYVEGLVGGGGLGPEMDRLRQECLDALAVGEEGVRPDPEEQARRDIEIVSGVDGRNRLGSTMVREEGALTRRFEAAKANEGDKPVNVGDYLRLSGWVRYRDVEAFEEWKAKVKENDLYKFVGDKGVRYMDPVTGMRCTSDQALSGQLIRDARDVGGFAAYKKLVDENRIE